MVDAAARELPGGKDADSPFFTTNFINAGVVRHYRPQRLTRADFLQYDLRQRQRGRTRFAALLAALDSWSGLLLIVQQTLIGIAMGLVLRVVFAALDLMGEIISLQMGLSFATFFDPVAGGQTAVVGEFLTLIATLVFLSLNGHLLMIDALARSFEWLPVSATLPHKSGWLVLARFGASIFASGLLMALPIVTALLITNIALGVLTRAAPQLNLFAIGFPITLTVGFGVLLLTLGHLAPLLQHFYDVGFATLADLLRALR